MAEKTSLNPSEVAGLLMASPISVCEWVQQGKLHAQLQADGERHFSLQDIHAFAKQYGLRLSRADRSRLRILVVDADRSFANRLAELFNTLSDTVEARAVHSAFDAGRKMHSFRPDVVLLNISGPQNDGLEICRLIKADPASHGVKVIAMAEQVSVEVKHRALLAGAESCLAKPLDNQALFAALGLNFEPQDSQVVESMTSIEVSNAPQRGYKS